VLYVNQEMVLRLGAVTGVGHARLPEPAGRLDDLPEHLQAGLFAAFDIQILWNQPMNQATFHAAITDTTPGIITDLTTRTAGDPASAVTGPGLPYTPLPAATPRQNLRVSLCAECTETDADHGSQPPSSAGRGALAGANRPRGRSGA
jgi:hypothetical protein